MAKKNILVVEDDENIAELVAYNLRKEGFEVRVAETGEHGLKRARNDAPDLLVLDLMLPGLDGLEVCRILKEEAETRHLPILILSAKGEESDIVAGLELGADDYVTKPFSPRILLARVRAVLRREKEQASREDEPVRVRDLLIHPGRREVSVKGKPVRLTFTEFEILKHLARHPGWVYTRHQIVDAVRGQDYAVTDRAVDVQIVGLRKKLGSYGKYIETVRGVGYRFKEFEG